MFRFLPAVECLVANRLLVEIGRSEHRRVGYANFESTAPARSLKKPARYHDVTSECFYLHPEIGPELINALKGDSTG